MKTDPSLTRYAHELYSPDVEQREKAARQLWLHFADRLGALVRRRLDPRILRRAGVDDVLQSLFASCFAAAPGPNGPPRTREDLWRLLVHFTMCKVANTTARHLAQRRDVRREQPLAADADENPAPAAAWAGPDDRHRLSPEDDAIAREEFNRALAVLPDDLRLVFTLRLEGHTNAEIAKKIDRTERMVEFKLRTVRGLLRPHFGIAPPSNPEGPHEPA